MGDPRKIRRSYLRPGHPWQAERIAQENELLKEYGLKNKTEIWKTSSQLRTIANQAKKLIAATKLQAQKERTQLLQRLQRLGLLPQTAKIDDVLSVTLKNILERRLQTVLVRKGLAKSMNQARQFIIHEHILVNQKKMTRPSHLVNVSEENTIMFTTTSSLASPDHPVRIVEKK